MLIGITFMRVASVSMLSATGVRGLTTRQNTLASGFYNIFPISVAGSPIGFIPGFSVGVEASTDPTPSNDNTFAVIQYPEGYILHLASGNAAAASAGDVTLVSSYPGSFWNIVPLDNGLYAIETTDGSLGWILPHDAPQGTAVSLATPSNPRIPAEFFDFVAVPV